jgi:hypothetical protein
LSDLFAYQPSEHAPNLIVVAFDSFGTVIASSNESASRLK